MSLRKAITPARTAALLIFLLAAGLFFVRLQREYAVLRVRQAEEAGNRQRKAELEGKLIEEERLLKRLRDDPRFVERVIRQKLGYARPDEYVIRFEE